MGTIERFEEFAVWKKARALSKEIYRISGVGEFYRDFGLKDQIRKTSGSIMDNIAEGAERSGKGEFMLFDELYTNTDEISRMIMGVINYLKRTPIRGQRYKPVEKPIN